MHAFDFQNPELSIEERADDLLRHMTLEEKISCLNEVFEIPRLGVLGTAQVEGLHGLAQGGPANWNPPRQVNTTIFPQSYGLGATWDRALIRKVAEVESTEARYILHNPNYLQGGVLVRAPNADLGRDPRWGRNEECFGEDAKLTGDLTVEFVRGLQGDHPKYWRTASLMKHFLANSHENNREGTSSDFDEQLWREYYSVPFRRGIQEGGSRAYMAAYNAINGIPCHVHEMHEQIARKEWGQDGVICTDGGGYMLLRTAHKWVETEAEAATQIIKAGIGQFLDDYKAGVQEALDAGTLTVEDIDKVLRTNIRVMIKLGRLASDPANPYEALGAGTEPWLSDEHKQFAREVTQKSIVLLKNNGILPLAKKALKRVALIGRFADKVVIDWYSGLPAYRVTPLEGIRAALGKDVEIVTAIEGDEAVEAARGADLVIACVGNHPLGNRDGWGVVERASDGKEAIDRESLDLEDEETLKAVFAVNPNLVLVLVSSFPYALNWSDANLPAILHITHGAQEQGNALADVLFGKVNPGGRTTQTWVRSLADLPPMLDYDLRKGRTYMYFEGSPLYPFGYGLTYTEFKYGRSEVAINDGKAIHVHVPVSNVGSVDGAEVVQVYVRFPESKVSRPNLQLKGFERLAVPAGETRTTEIFIPFDDLRYWSVEQKGWVLEPGRVEIIVASNALTHEQTLQVEVSEAVYA